MIRSRWIWLATLALSAAPVEAQSPGIAIAIQAGQVGERYDGYMGYVGNPSPELRRQVSAINIRRRNLYIDLASRRNVTAQVVGLATACELFAQLPVGGTYMLEDGAWRRRASGQPAPVPNYCR
jgi:uncharacterized protein YdbL (DUF1318 family)